MDDEKTEFEKFQELVKSQVEAYAGDAVKERLSDLGIGQRQIDPDQQMRNTVRSFVSSDLDEAKLIAADARDYTDFYTTRDDAKLYKDEVEKTFEMLKKAGRATTRKDILRHVIGSEYLDDPVKFKEKEAAKEKAQLDKAAMAGDVGSNANSRERDERFKNFESLSLEEMEKALEGVTF